MQEIENNGCIIPCKTYAMRQTEKFGPSNFVKLVSPKHCQVTLLKMGSLQHMPRVTLFDRWSHTRKGRLLIGYFTLL